ncbi:hypothetical protein Tco_0078611 [Tanacetum coccineum]
MLQKETLLDVVIVEFCSPSRWKELSKETSSKILPCGDGSCWKIPKSVERAFVLHQPDGVGWQRHHIVPYGELNGVSITLMASFGVISKSADKIFVFHGGFLLRRLRSDVVVRFLTPSLSLVRYDGVAKNCDATPGTVHNSSRDFGVES